MKDVTTAGSEGLAILDTKLLPECTFDNFAEGAANEFALRVSRKVVDGTPMETCVLYHGPPGVGKTHLLQATVREYAASDRSSLRYFDCFSLTYSRPDFEAIIVQPDAVFIDNVELLRDADAAWRVRNALTARIKEGRMTVMAGDLREWELAGKDLFSSTIRSGLSCLMDIPDESLRLAILEKHLAFVAPTWGAEPRAVPGVLELLSRTFPESSRDMVGALRTLVARTQSGFCTMSLEHATDLINATYNRSNRKLTVDDIQKAVCEHYGLTQTDLICERRARAVARPRQIAMWLCKQLTMRSMPDIGRRFGGRDHTTVLHAHRRIDALRKDDAVVLRDTERLLQKLRR